MKHKSKHKLFQFLSLLLAMLNILSCVGAADLVGKYIQQTRGHRHTFVCYDDYQIICGDDAHTHRESCYVGIGNVACGLEEGDMEHVHNSWQNEGQRWTCEEFIVLSCDKEEHQHDQSCFSEVEEELEPEEVVDPDALGSENPPDMTTPEETDPPDEPGEDEEENSDNLSESDTDGDELGNPDDDSIDETESTEDSSELTEDEVQSDSTEDIENSDESVSQEAEAATPDTDEEGDPDESPAEAVGNADNAESGEASSDSSDTTAIKAPESPFAPELTCTTEDHIHGDECFTVIWKCRLENAAQVNTDGITIDGAWKTSTTTGNDNTITVTNDGKDASWKFSNSTYFNYGIDFSLSVEPGVSFEKDQVHVFLPYDVIPLRDGQGATFGNISSMLKNNDVWSLKGTKELSMEDFAAEYFQNEIAAVSDVGVDYVPESNLEESEWNEAEQEKAEALSTLTPEELDGYTDEEVILEQIPEPFADPDEKIRYYEIVNDKRAVSGEQKFSFSGYIKDELYKVVDGTEFEYPVYVVVTGDGPTSTEMVFKGKIDTNLHESYLRETSYQSNYIRDHGLQRIYTYDDKLRTRYGVEMDDFEIASDEYAYLEYVFDAHISGNKAIKYNMKFTPNKNGEILGFCNIDDSRLITPFLNTERNVKVEDGNAYTLLKDATLYTTAGDGKSHTFGVLVRYKKADIESNVQSGCISVNFKAELEISDLDNVDDLTSFNRECTLTNTSSYNSVGYTGELYSGLLKPAVDDRLGTGALSDLAAGLDSVELPVIAECAYRAFMNNDKVNNDFVADPDKQYKLDMFVDKMYFMDDSEAKDCDDSYYITRMEDLKITDGYQEMDESGEIVNGHSVDIPEQLVNTKVEVWVCTSDAPNTWVKDGDVLLVDCWEKNYRYGSFNHENVIRVKIHYPTAYGYAKMTSKFYYKLRGETLQEIAEKMISEHKQSAPLINWGGVIAYDKEDVPYELDKFFLVGSSVDDVKAYDNILWRPFFESYGYSQNFTPYRMTTSRSLTVINRSANMSLGMKAWDLKDQEVSNTADLNINVLSRMSFATKATVNLGRTSATQINDALARNDPDSNNIMSIKKAVFFTLLPEGLEYYRVEGGTDGKYLTSVGPSNQAIQNNGVTYLWHQDNYADTNRTMVCYSVDQPAVAPVRGNDYGFAFGATVTARPIAADIYPGAQSVNTAGFFVLENGEVFDFTGVTEDTIFSDDGSVFSESKAFTGLEEAWTAREPGDAVEKLSVVGQKCEMNVSGRPVSTELRILSKGSDASRGYAPVTAIAPVDDYSYRMSFIIGGTDQISNLGIVANLEDYDSLMNADVTRLSEFPTKMTGLDLSGLPDDLQKALKVYVNPNYVNVSEYNQNPTQYSGKNIDSIDGWTEIDYRTYTNWDSVKAIYFYFADKTICVPVESPSDYMIFHIILKMQTPEDGWYDKDTDYNAFCQAVYIDNLFGVDADTRFSSSGSNIAEVQIRLNGTLNPSLKTNYEYLDGQYSDYDSSSLLLGSGQKFNYAYDAESEGTISDLTIMSCYLPDRWVYESYDLFCYLNNVKDTGDEKAFVWLKSDEAEYNDMYEQAQSFVRKDDIQSLLDLGWVEYTNAIDKTSIRGLLFSFGSKKFSSNDKADFTVSNIGADEVHTGAHELTSYPIKYRTIYRIYGTNEFDNKECAVTLNTVERENIIKILSSREDEHTKNTPMDLKRFDEIQGNIAENLSHLVSYGVSKADSYQPELILNDYDTFDTVVDIPAVFYGRNLKAIVSIDNPVAEITGIEVIGAKHIDMSQPYILHGPLDSEAKSLTEAGFIPLDNFDNAQAIAFDLGPDYFLLDDALPNNIQGRYVIHWKSKSAQCSSTIKAQLYYDSIGCLEDKESSDTNIINFNSNINPSIDITLNYPDDAITRDTTLLYPSDFSYTLKFALDQKSVLSTDIVIWTPMDVLAPADGSSISRFFTINSVDTTYWTDAGVPITVFGSKSEDITTVSGFFREGTEDGNHKFVEYLKENWDMLDSNSDLSEYKQLAFWMGDPNKENADGYNENGSYWFNPIVEKNYLDNDGQDAGIIVNMNYNLDEKAFIDFYKGKTIHSLNNRDFYVLNTNQSTVSSNAIDYGQAANFKFSVNKTVAHRNLTSDDIQNAFTSALDWLTSLKLSYYEHYTYKLELNATDTVNATDIILLDTIEYKAIWESLDEKFRDSGDSSQFHCQLEGVDMSEFEAENIPYTIYYKTEIESRGALWYDSGFYYENGGITPEILQRDWIRADDDTDWSQVKRIAIWLGTPEGGSWVDPLTENGTVLSDQPHSAYLLMKAEFDQKIPVGQTIYAYNGVGLHYDWGNQAITIHDFGKYTDVSYTHYNTDSVVSTRRKEVRSGPEAEYTDSLGTKPGWDYEYRLSYKVEKGTTNVVFADSIEHIMGEDKTSSSGLILEEFTLLPNTYKLNVGDENPVMTIRVRNAGEFPIDKINLQFSNPDFASLCNSFGFETEQYVDLSAGQSQTITFGLSGLTEPQTISTTVKAVCEEYHLESNSSESVTLTVLPQFRTITYKNTTDGDNTTVIVRENEGKSEEQITAEFLGKVSEEYKGWHDFEGWADSETEPDTKIAQWTSYAAQVTYMNAGVPVTEKLETLPIASQDSRIKNAIDVLVYPKVKTIANSNFENCLNLTSIVLHDDISTIGSKAFSGCSNLESIDLPANLTLLQSYAFKDCISLRSITIPEKVTTIPSYGFLGCSNLTEVILFENITTISSQAFKDCRKLEVINLPDGLKTINGSVFINCSKLETINLPDTITSIGESAFENCTKLNNIIIPQNVTIIQNATFKNCVSLSAVRLSDNLTNINQEAFYGCAALEYIEIPNSVKTIGGTVSCSFNPDYPADTNAFTYSKGAFEKCSGLKSVVIPGSISTIGNSMFKDCTSLSNVVISEGVTTIGHTAFYNCPALTSIDIPASVQNIQTGAFKRCSLLSDIKITDSILEVGGYAFSGCSMESFKLPDGVKNVGSYTFLDCKSLKTIELPEKVNSFGMGQFMGCGNLISASLPIGTTSIQNMFLYCGKIEKVELPNTITRFTTNAFNGCGSLTSLSFPSGIPCITGIDNNAFRGCKKLDTIDIVSSVTSIGENSFDGCDNLTINYIGTELQFAYVTKNAKWNPQNRPVNFLENNIYTNQLDGDRTTIYADETEESLDEITERFLSKVPDDYKKWHEFQGWADHATKSNIKIAQWTKYKCEVEYLDDDGNLVVEKLVNLSNSEPQIKKAIRVEVYPSVTSITMQTFQDCTSLTSVILPETISSIGEAAFYNCPALESIVIPNSVSSFGSSVFYGCSALKTVTLSDNMRSIPEYTFYNCKSLTSIVIPNIVTTIYQYAFYNCDALTSIIIPSNVMTISPHAFESCNELSSVKFSASLTSIGDYAFYSCNNLKTIELPDKITSIKSNAFASCSNLIVIKMPANLSTLGASAFQDCTALETIDIPESVTTINSNTFRNCTSLVSVTFPARLQSIADCAFYNCRMLTSIELPDSLMQIGGTSGIEINSITATGAFENCIALKSVVIPANVKTIGTAAFKGCTSLTTIILSDNLLNIAQSAFHSCSAITEISIPGSVTCIGNGAFYKCTSLTDAKIQDGVEVIDGYAFYGCSKLKEIIIPDSVYHIASFAFSYCSSLTDATLSKGLYVISESLFENDSSLKAIVIPGRVSSIDKNAFSDCTSLASVTISNGIQNIGYAAFYKCASLASITLPSSIVNIDAWAFAYCESLTAITIPSKITNIKDQTFYGCSRLVSVSLSNGITMIGESAFCRCTALPSIFIPNSVTSIGAHAFRYDESLRSISLSDNINDIGASCFSDCSSLKTITIPDTIESIGSYALNASSVVIHFLGTEAQFDAVEKGSSWNSQNRPVIYCGAGSCPDHPAITLLSTPSSPFAEFSEYEQTNSEDEIIEISEYEQHNPADEIMETSEINVMSEAAPVLTEQSGWRGTLTAIDTSDIEAKGLTAVVFVSTEEVDDWWPVLQPWNDIINTSKKIKTLEWYQKNAPIGFMPVTPQTDLSVMKSVVVQVVDLRSYDGMQSDYYMNEGDELFVTLKMHIPENITEIYPNLWQNPYTFNQFFTLENTLSPAFEGEEPGEAGVIKTRLTKSNQASASMFVNVHLPETGGPGVILYFIFGATLILDALLILKKRKKSQNT